MRLPRLQDLLLHRRGLVFAVPAGALAVLVIVAAMNFDAGTETRKRPSRIQDAQDLLAPRTATAEELARASGSVGDQAAVSLAAGAWIQVADETGRLAQQYSATRLEPLQGSQLAMTEPRAMVYLKDGRVLVLSARKGVAYVPRRALESGTLEEDVEVRLFRPEGGRSVDIERDLPAVVVTAAQAQFDGVLGEVRCAKAVRVSTDAGTFAGEGLTLQLDADGDGLEQLVVDRATEPIRIDRAARALSAKRREARADARGAVPALPEGNPADGASASVVADGSGSAAPSSAAPAAADRRNRPKRADRPPFYRLTMLGGVEVVRIKDGVRSTITGEEIVAVFSLESRGLDDLAFLPRPNDVHREAPNDMRIHASAAHAALAMVPLVFAAPQDAGAIGASDADSVTVTFGGKLVMVPALDPGDQLASQDEIRLDVVGPRVEVLDGKTGSRIVCTRLRYGVQEQYVEATGTAESPLQVSNPRMRLDGTRFFASLAKGEGRIDGAGRMQLGRGLSRKVSLLGDMPHVAVDASRMLVSADPAAIAVVAAAPRAQDAVAGQAGAASPGDFRFDPATQEIEITWKDGVDLRFSGEGDDAKLSLARFGGGVNVFGRQFELDSNSLEVAFSPNDAERIDAIIADGGTRVRRLGGEGAMAAGRIELFLGEDSRGDTIPRRLVARGAVEARDERQTVWTEDLVVAFREKAKEAAAAKPEREQSATGLVGDTDLGAIDIDTVEAKGGVQVLLKEGARVFAETLVGDAARRRLRLTGENVAIVRSNVIADNLRDIRFDDATRSARSDGPGRFRAFRQPLAVGEGRAERPNPDARPTLEAAWGESLEYAEVAEDRGTLDIRGEVKVRSRPSETTSDAVDAQSILLELGIDPAARGSDKKDGEGAAGGRADPSEAARSFEHFIAKGGARLESRTWPTAERKGEPRVFRVSGEHVEYDIRTREGLVVGDGTILVNIPRAEDGKAVDPAAGARAPGGIALGADGTTRFRWKERMALERQYDDVFRIRMEKDVEMLHAGIRADDSLSMRCDTLEATVKRPDESKKAGEGGARTESDGGVDLGGPAELVGVKGIGRVFIRTPEQDIECGEFDYSVTTGVATLTAEPGRTVTIAIKGQPAPIRAQQVTWDLRNGRIQISKMSATGGR
ncbi:MAG: hypothetical protein LW806_03610 [Planctomycetaceae bacterium]|nr:hypothetical protein [Planctomycetaceae bacterium]